MFWLCIVFAVVNLVDLVTAYYILPGEANPLYLLTGSIILVDILKIGLVVGLFYFCLRNVFPTHFNYYMLLMVLGLGSLVVGMGAYSNISGIINPEIVQTAQNIPQAEKIEAYFYFVEFIYVLPMIISLTIFKLYDISLKNVEIDKEYYKKRKWWKF